MLQQFNFLKIIQSKSGYRFIRASLLLAIFYSFSLAGNSQIVGDPIVCEGETEMYTISIPGAISYLWTTVDGQISGADNQSTVFVTWQVPSLGASVDVAVTNSSNVTTNYSLNVSVYENPNPIIVSDFESGCIDNPGKDDHPQGDGRPIDIDDECLKACENSTIKYYIAFADPTSSFAWNVFGGVITYQNMNASEIEITWNSPVGSTGLIQVTETSAQGCVGIAERCVDIIDNPKALFDINPQAQQYCLDQDIFFTNMSIGNNLSYVWSFGDGNTSIDENPIHQYDVAGNYDVWLKVYNECGCVDSVMHDIKIIDEPAPEIVCISTVCAGDISYYAVTNVCPNYSSLFWTVTGGNLVSGQGTLSPEVQWGNVPVGILEVMVDGCACSTTARAEVPILTDNLSIEGPMTICVGEEATFSIPCQPGRVMTWTTPGGDIVSRNPHDHEVLVEFTNPGNYNVQVTLSTNEIYRCVEDGFVVNYPVKVVPRAFITPGDDEFCEGDTQNFTIGFSGGSCTAPVGWIIKDGTGTAVTTNVNTCSFPLPTNLAPGNYELVATLNPTDYEVCNYEVSHYFVVNPKPGVPQFGTGDLIVCPNEAFEYTAIPDMGNIIEWTIIGGNSGGATVRTGNEISVVWTSLPGTLEIRQYAATGLGCPSSPTIVTISEIDPNLYNISGINSTCAINQVTFPFSIGVQATSFDWHLVPEELGSVITGQFTNSVGVVFQAPSNLNFPTSVDLVCDAVVCGNPVSYTHTIVLEALDITLSVPTGPLCEGDPLPVSAASNLTGYNTTYQWYINGVLQPGNASTNNLNTTGINGTISITVEGTVNDPGSACDGSTSTDAGQIVILAGPDVSVPNIVHLCGNNPIIVYANQQSVPGGGPGTYTYQWFDPTNTSISPNPNAAAITLNPNTALTGVYSVIITDPVNGCTVTKYISVDNNCTPLPPCPANNFFTWSVNCQDATLVPTIGTGTFVQWIYGDGSSGTSNNHFYGVPGYYGVMMEVLLPNNTTCFVQETVPVLMRPDFESHFGCGPPGMRSVQFYDRTEYLNGLSGSYTYNWNVSGAGPMTGSTPMINLAPGTYTVDLTINYSGAPYSTSCFISQTVVVPDVVLATLPSYPPVCEGNSISFATAGSGPIISSIWNFGDGSVSFDPSPSKTYDNITSNTVYTVTYTVMDEYGCIDIGTTNISVLDNTLEGNVSIAPGITTAACDQLTLTANGPGVTSYDWIDVYDPTVTIGTLQNQTITNSGVYGVEMTDGQSCRAYIESEPMIIYPSPDPIYAGEVEYCIGELVELNAMLGSDYDYEWVYGATYSGPTFTTVINTPGTYTVMFTITDNNVMNPPGSCSTTVPIVLTIHPNPIVSIVEPFICAPDLAHVSSPNPNYLYSWSNGETGPIANVYYETAIEVTAVDQNGCEAKDLVEISEGPDFCNTMVGCYNICKDEVSTFNWLGPVGPSQSPPFYTYQWLMMDVFGVFNPVVGQTGPTFPFGTPGYGSGFYKVEVTDEFGCVDTSDIIDIDITENCKCDVELKDVKLECTGQFDQNGYPIYDITIVLVNYGLGISGWNVQTNGGTITNINPSSIPGGSPSNPTTTVLTGQYIYDGSVNPLCALFTGFNLSTGEECKFEFCREVPECHNEPCNFEIEPLKPECIGVVNGVYYYNMDWIFYNNGNPLEVLFIKTNNNQDHVSLTSGSQIPGYTTSQLSLLFSTTNPGTICFDIYFEDASGKICYYHLCVDFKKDDCKEIKKCEFKYKAEAECIYQHDIGSYYYSFDIDIDIPNPGNWSVSLVPTGGPFNVLNYNTAVTGVNNLNISGDYVSYDGQDEPCFDIILTNNITGEICVFAKLCLKITKKCKNSYLRDGNKEQLTSTDVSVFPNPSAGLVQIIGLDKIVSDEEVEIEVINYSGALMKAETMNLEDYSLINLYLEDLSSGLYLIKINVNDQIITKRIILTKE